MQYAIFSDIHNNTQALREVLRDASRRNVDAYLCLGDVGTDPCQRMVRSVGAETVFGNWEVSGWRYLSPEYQKQVLNLPPVRKYDGFWISHATPVWPEEITTLQKYLENRRGLGLPTVFPYYTYESDALWKALIKLFDAEIPLLFHGHTHQQIVWTCTLDNRLKKKMKPRGFNLEPQNTYVIGVGSVGQPKYATSPCYVVFDSDTMGVEFILVG